MTFPEVRLLRKLKKAQINEDGSLFIDYENMKAITVHEVTQEFVEVNLEKYQGSIHSILKCLEQKDLIELSELGYARVNHEGWHSTKLTVQNAVKFTIRDIIVPVIAAILTVLVTELLLE